MIKEKKGAIIITGNTAALRGIPTYALFAPTKAAQRILAQALARDLGPKGVHVAYLTIDAVIDTPWSLKYAVQGLNTEPLNQRPQQPKDFFCQPADIAAEVFHVAHQPRSAWSFDVEIRQPAQMQQIAREFSLSETAFIFPSRVGGHAVMVSQGEMMINDE